MKRRAFLFGSAAAITAAALPFPALALPPAVPPPVFPIGSLMAHESASFVTVMTDKGWVECLGQTLSKHEYPLLARATSNWWAGNADTFAIVDARDWAPGDTTRATVEFWNEVVVNETPIEFEEAASPEPEAVFGVPPLRNKTVDDNLDRSRPQSYDAAGNWVRPEDVV